MKKLLFILFTLLVVFPPGVGADTCPDPLCHSQARTLYPLLDGSNGPTTGAWTFNDEAIFTKSGTEYARIDYDATMTPYWEAYGGGAVTPQGMMTFSDSAGNVYGQIGEMASGPQAFQGIVLQQVTGKYISFLAYDDAGGLLFGFPGVPNYFYVGADWYVDGSTGEMNIGEAGAGNNYKMPYIDGTQYQVLMTDGSNDVDFAFVSALRTADGSHNIGISDDGTDITLTPSVTDTIWAGSNKFCFNDDDSCIYHDGTNMLITDDENVGFSSDGTNAFMTVEGQGVIHVSVVAGGTGYSAGTLSATGGGGSGFAANYTVTGGVIDTAVEITNTGSGYTSIPTIVISDPGNGDADVVCEIGVLFVNEAGGAFAFGTNSHMKTFLGEGQDPGYMGYPVARGLMVFNNDMDTAYGAGYYPALPGSVLWGLPWDVDITVSPITMLSTSADGAGMLVSSVQYGDYDLYGVSAMAFTGFPMYIMDVALYQPGDFTAIYRFYKNADNDSDSWAGFSFDKINDVFRIYTAPGSDPVLDPQPYVAIGFGNTSHAIGGSGLYCPANFEVDGYSYFDGTVRMYGIAGIDGELTLGSHVRMDGGGYIYSEDDSSTLNIQNGGYFVASKESDGGSGGFQFDLVYAGRASPADYDTVAAINFMGDNDANEETQFVQIKGQAIDVSDGAEDGSFRVAVMVNGSMTDMMYVETPNILMYGFFRSEGLDAGDWAGSDYTRIEASTGNIRHYGVAGYYPRRISQSAEPGPSSGEMYFWHDTDDGKVYLMYNDPSTGVVKIELT